MGRGFTPRSLVPRARKMRVSSAPCCFATDGDIICSRDNRLQSAGTFFAFRTNFSISWW
jgi:hypothetical protein